MTAPLVFQQLSLRWFRNLESLRLTPAPRLNVIAGDNGQGKTSLLEALYFVATSRSFRTERISELLQHGADHAVVQARVLEGPVGREQRGVLSGKTRSMTLDGKAPETLASYATRTPVVAFHPGDLLLVTGPATERRTLLDRLALFMEPSSADHRQRYQRALRERQRLLEGWESGTEGALGAFEQVMAEHGAALVRLRRRVAARFAEALEPAFARMAAPGLGLEARLVSAGTDEAEAFAQELAQRRELDRRRRSASFGPQRDDLSLSLDGRSARHHASQGQQRILTLALKAAELECVREARQAHPVLLLDDVSSELDPGRTGAVYDFLRQTASQVFVTTTRPELFATPELGPGERLDWRLSGGALVASSPAA